MRVLFLTNFYPPHSFGGYEEWCHEVALSLCSKGHEVVVLTSRHQQRQIANGNDPPWVQRELHLEMPFQSLRNSWAFFTERRKHEQENLSIVSDTVLTFEPDAALIWGMWNIPRSVPARVEALMGHKVAYYIGDYWPSLRSQHWAYWEAPASSPVVGFSKAGLRKIAHRQLAQEGEPDLELRTAMVPSVFLQSELERQGIRPQRVVVVPGAIDTTPYLSATGVPPKQKRDGASLLYVGRLTEDKGVRTAIEAMAKLVERPESRNVTLQIAGSGSETYIQELRTLARSLAVDQRINWLGKQPKEALPSLYRSADIFLFTSVWPEPFGRVIVEAMASGTAVVGSAVGGAAEILHDNALTYTPGDAIELAAQIGRLLDDEAFRISMAHRAQSQATEIWDTQQMVSSVEGLLCGL